MGEEWLVVLPHSKRSPVSPTIKNMFSFLYKAYDHNNKYYHYSTGLVQTQQRDSNPSLHLLLLILCVVSREMEAVRSSKCWPSCQLPKLWGSLKEGGWRGGSLLKFSTPRSLACFCSTYYTIHHPFSLLPIHLLSPFIFFLSSLASPLCLSVFSWHSTYAPVLQIFGADRLSLCGQSCNWQQWWWQHMACASDMKAIYNVMCVTVRVIDSDVHSFVSAVLLRGRPLLSSFLLILLLPSCC